MGLQTLVEVVRADTRNNDGEEEQEDRENGECSQRLASWLVVLLAQAVCNVHADELEQKVCKRDKVNDDADDHTNNGLAAHPEGGSEEQEEGDNQCRSREDDFDC